MIVLDASLTLAYCFADESTPAVRATVDLLGRQGAWVVSFWHIEVANALEVAVRRKRVDAVSRDGFIERLQRWPVYVDAQTDRHAWTRTKVLAELHSLTLYDAAYIELAMRLDLPLATLDKALRRAAEAEGVLLLGL